MGRGRPKGNAKTIEKKQCQDCKKPLALTNFYNTNSVLTADGKLDICKKCVKKKINYNDMTTVYKILQQMDIAFLYSYWRSAIEKSPEDPWGVYIRMANSKMNEFAYTSWKDSEFEPKVEEINTQLSNNSQKININNFTVTDEIIDKWGFGYKDEEYYYFEKKWQKLIDNYGEKTSFHVEALITYIRFRVKEELSTARGEIKEAKEWGVMAKDAATAAKINVSQLSKSDISGGVDLLPQLFEAVESEVGIISILPNLKEQPYDDADLIIWAVINYLRRLDDKPRVEYKDIWCFYDDMLTEHFKSQGYSDNQIEMEKKKRNNIFRDLGQVYKEPVYEEGDL